MQLGMIELGRMGANMVRRLLRAGHDCVVYDIHADAVQALVQEGATGATALPEFVAALNVPRALWLMVPAALADQVLAALAPLRDPRYYQYDLNLTDIAEVWRRGSVIASWLLDLTAIALLGSPDLAPYAGRVSDSGEGRWTIAAAIDEAVPTPVLSAALYERFASRGEADFADRLLSAMRFQFGGHLEKAAHAEGV